MRCFRIGTIPHKNSNAPPEAAICCEKTTFITATFQAYGGWCEFDTQNTDFGWSSTLITHIVQVAVDGQKRAVLACRGAGQV